MLNYNKVVQASAIYNFFGLLWRKDAAVGGGKNWAGAKYGSWNGI
ncbi:MAG TPA: hypothetical protein PLP33_27460 [Leptospiraceae bacterium]|nr:hypothetical protein [Leptospiraceae bacterium]